MRLLLDTGPFAMLLSQSRRMSEGTREVLQEADAIYVPAVAFYEIGQKVRLGKWQDMEPYIVDLDKIALEAGFQVLALTSHLSLQASLLKWEHRDPFDRMIAATSLMERLPLVSMDRAFDDIGVERIWD